MKKTLSLLFSVSSTFLCTCPVLGIKPRASHMRGKCSNTLADAPSPTKILPKDVGSAVLFDPGLMPALLITMNKGYCFKISNVILIFIFKDFPPFRLSEYVKFPVVLLSLLSCSMAPAARLLQNNCQCSLESLSRSIAFCT